MAGSGQQPASVPHGEEAPRIESFDDWAHLLRGTGSGEHHRAPAAEARPFRPLLRRPMALLHVVDDGREHGEIIRLRGDRLVIGRCDGDLVIPHDISMSPKHAAIDRLDDGAWLLSDLGSSGGTFVRVTSARLRDGTTIRIGATVLRFQTVDVTESWLVEVPATGLGRRHECHGPATTVGREGCGCGIELRDPFVSPVHAELHGSARGWRIDNSGTNGLWVRLDGPVRMTAPSQFLCGEQRFVFEPLAE